jgi:hypothetical protein
MEEPDHEITENEGTTALMKAVYMGHAKVCKVLVDAGADVDFKEDMTGRTALHRAALQGFAHITQILVDGGADVKGDAGATALNVAAMFGHSDVEKVLLDAGAVRHISGKPKTGRETNKGRGSDVADSGDFNMMDMSALFVVPLFSLLFSFLFSPHSPCSYPTPTPPCPRPLTAVGMDGDAMQKMQQMQQVRTNFSFV